MKSSLHIFLFMTLIIRSPVTYTAASSSSATDEENMVSVIMNGQEHRLNRSVLSHMPYFQAILSPADIVKAYYNLDYDYTAASDQENMAKIPLRKRLDDIVAFSKNMKNIQISFESADDQQAFFILYNILQKMTTSDLTNEQLTERIKKVSLPQTTLKKMAQELLSPEAFPYIFNQWEKKILKQKLSPSPEGLISDAFFSPAENMLLDILTLIKAEKKEIYVACYLFDNNAIIDELVKATQRGVKVYIIVDAIASSSAQLRRAQLPFYGWQRSSSRSSHPPKMHNKFFIFTENIFGKSILVVGSANCTVSAQENNEENMIISSNPELIEQFKYRFNYLLTSCRQIKATDRPRELTAHTPRDFSPYAPHATRLLRIIDTIAKESILIKRQRTS